MIEINFVIDERGDPVCTAKDCRLFYVADEGYSVCKQVRGQQGKVRKGSICIPGLRQQRDEARKKR